MDDVVRFAESGGIVVGICNGFQVLLEVGLLKGALIRNTNGAFICRYVNVAVQRYDTALTNAVPRDKKFLRIPIAHADGNYSPPQAIVDEVESQNLVLFRYVDDAGEPTKAANPNGSVNNIAGLMNRQGNVFGLMPHPERADEPVLGSTDGLYLLRSLVEHF
jgi:phosphoribosylformylglycinamidine synthase